MGYVVEFYYICRSITGKINHRKVETFRIKSYTKTELALLYNPHSQESSAIQNLYRWIRRCKPLVDELEAVGYNKYRHSFLKQEVEIIVKYLGEP